MLLSKTFILLVIGGGAALTGRGWMAYLLAWAFPGLGHWWIGERRRALLAGGGVLGLFLAGLLIGGLDCVDQREDGPWFLAQAWNGPIAFAADLANERLLKTGRIGELLPSPAPATSPGAPPNVTQVSTLKGIGVVNDVGTLYIALGGLMNLVVMLDAASRARRVAEEDDDE